MRKPIQTNAAPAAIGNYSQAIKVNKSVYLSGQIPLDPSTMTLVEGDINVQAIRVFQNLKSVAEAAGGSLSNVVKLSIYLLDLSQLPVVNDVMHQFFPLPFPARTSIGVAALPKNASIEVDAIMILDA